MPRVGSGISGYSADHLITQTDHPQFRGRLAGPSAAAAWGRQLALHIASYLENAIMNLIHCWRGAVAAGAALNAAPNSSPK